MTRRRWTLAAVALASALLMAACGRYGPPVRSAPAAPAPAPALSSDPPAADPPDPGGPIDDPAAPVVPEPDFEIKLPETLDAPDDEDDPE